MIHVLAIAASSIQDGGAATAPRVGDVRGMAEEAFDSGLHCAEAVASALAALYHRCERYTVRAAQIAAALLALSGADALYEDYSPCKPMT